jgi:jumonji domain-containing protein 7
MQDPYENIYAVVRGSKTFTLLPPADAYRLHMQLFPVARYQQHGLGELRLVMQEPKQVST